MTSSTPAEIHALNLRMAREVMGWKEQPADFSAPIELPEIRHITERRLLLVRSAASMAKPADIEDWSPATLPAQAVEVAEKFGDDETGFYLDGAKMWVNVWSNGQRGQWWADIKWDGHGGNYIQFNGPFPLAICRAISAAIAAGAKPKEKP